MIGRTVGRYHIVEALGEGGAGTVWKARDKLLDRTVAIKFLRQPLASSGEARRRFLREARAASALDHPNVATVFDAGEAEGLLYIAYSFVAGRTVSQLVGDGRQPVAEAIRIGCEAGEALGHAHGRGILHRDISGRNIMVAHDGRVKVLDFGLARWIGEATSRITQPGAAVGTIAYMAPEVLRGEDADARSDLYGLGAVVYELLTGAPPFVAERPEAVAYLAMHGKLERPSVRRAEIPARCDRILFKLLARDSRRRYATAEELVDDLRSLEGRLADRVADHSADGRVGQAARGRSPTHGQHAARLSAATQRDGAPTPAGGIPEIKCLAVLPFRSLSASGASDSRAQMFAQGLAETVSVRLASVPGVQVIPPRAGGSGAREEDDLRRDARDLGANLLLSGSVQRAGRRVRITFSLLSAERGVQIAGDTVDGAASAIFQLEDQLVGRVLRSLEVPVATPHPEARRGPRDPAAHEHFLQALGYLQRYENDASVDGAIGLLERLIESEGEMAGVEAALGRAYLAKFRLTKDRRWERKAEEACGRALELDPQAREVRLTLGHLHSAVGRYPAAAREFRHALRKREDDPEAWIGLAVASSEYGKFDEAEQACRRAIALRPLYWAGYNWLGVFHFKRGRYAEASEQWKNVVKLSPENERGHANLGAAYYHMGRHEEAIAAYRRSIEIQPSAVAFASLGTVHFYLRRYHEAVAMFEKGARLRPYDPVMWGNLADAYRWLPGCEAQATTAYDQAISLMHEQLEINPNAAKPWCELAVWLAKRGKAREALPAVRRGLRLDSGDVNNMALAVTVYHLVGDRDRALGWLEKAVGQGYDRVELERDPELAALRFDPEFKRILDGREAR